MASSMHQDGHLDTVYTREKQLSQLGFTSSTDHEVLKAVLFLLLEPGHGRVQPTDMADLA